MSELFIFSGTTEGRLLVDELLSVGIAGSECARFKLHIFTATEYGKELLTDVKEDVFLHAGRLGTAEMYAEMMEYRPEYVIDATHPHAAAVTENIMDACEQADINYLRLLREDPDGDIAIDRAAIGGESGNENANTVVRDIKEAAAYLKEKSGNVLLTTGSKELEPFASPELRDRTFVRMLPMEGNIELCGKLGFPTSHLILMQGPFSEDLNRAIIRQFDIKYVVTKDSGTVGGFSEKVRSAASEGAESIIISRPVQRSGYDLAGILKILGYRHKWFPMFQNISDKKVLVIGGGNIALRRVKTLLKFDCRIEIITPELNVELEKLAESNEDAITVVRRKYQSGDCTESEAGNLIFVTAVTGDREVNHVVAEECKENGILVSVADAAEESTILFPAIIVKGDLVTGMTSGGTNHKQVREAAGKIRKVLSE